MRAFVASLALFYCFVAGVPATAQVGAEIAGTYSAKGTNPNGRTYYGSVVIKAEDGHFLFTWLISGQQQIKGVGVKKDNTLVVEWGQKDPVIYEIGSDGVLRGKWARGRGTEILTPMR